MKFLLDENTGKEVARFLEKLGHIASRIRLISPGIEDYEVLDLSVSKHKNLKNKFIAKQEVYFITVKERGGKFKIRVNKINSTD